MPSQELAMPPQELAESPVNPVSELLMYASPVAGMSAIGLGLAEAARLPIRGFEAVVRSHADRHDDEIET